MSRTVTVGVDGSRESPAAVEWAAREARLRGVPLRLVGVREPLPGPLARAPFLGAESRQDWTVRSERLPRETADGVRLRHPDVDVTVEQHTGRPGETLVTAAKGSGLLVLGSRGLSGVGGFLLGSVSQAVVAHTEVPVVLVRAGERDADEYEPDPAGTGGPFAATGFRPVVLGLDTARPAEAVLAFAFEEAARRTTALRVVHGWTLPPYVAFGLPGDPEPYLEAYPEAYAPPYDSPYVQPYAEPGRQAAAHLAAVLRPWKQRFPAVEVVEDSRPGSPADHLVDASRDASLVVVGRRIRRSPFGIHIGPVAHAVLHHATAPVAVVAHG
ncbi:universal stress protein [Streptomyces poonensis]|uniref:Stress-inducible protein n=1 Tax=Streptomyces poonensis TaxID=68255 RepID=A0A918PGC2_9ACTN|nr:universal stress protein [Streptomyces poonensis]GGZ05438.1 stress-inducible protein [Streptomyces poonensis]GLJ92544.1 stress-inducible protein [Streptomyces poonensis]